MMILLRRQRSPVGGNRTANQRRASRERPRCRRRHLIRAGIERTAIPEMPVRIPIYVTANDLCQSFYALLDDEDPEGALDDLTVPAKPTE